MKNKTTGTSHRPTPQRRARILAPAVLLSLLLAALSVGGCDGTYYGTSAGYYGGGYGFYPDYSPFYGSYGYNGYPYAGYGGFYGSSIVIRGSRHNGSFGRHHFEGERMQPRANGRSSRPSASTRAPSRPSAPAQRGGQRR